MSDIISRWTIKRPLPCIAPIVRNDFSFLLSSLSKLVDYCLDKRYHHTLSSISLFYKERDKNKSPAKVQQKSWANLASPGIIFAEYFLVTSGMSRGEKPSFLRVSRSS